jgi:hypothetical protein
VAQFFSDRIDEEAGRFGYLSLFTARNQATLAQP